MAPPSPVSFVVPLLCLSLVLSAYAEGNITATREKPDIPVIAASTAGTAADAIGTVVSLYDQNNKIFARVRAPDSSKKCLNIPALSPGQYISTVRIQWNVRDSNPNHAVCSVVWLWTDTDCYGNAQGYCLGDCTQTQPHDVTRYDYPDTVEKLTSKYQKLHAIGCTVYSNNPCKNYKCQPNSQCSLDSNLKPVCKCNAGYGFASGICTKGCNICTPLKANCKLLGGVHASCFCNKPNKMTTYGCQSPEDLAHADYLNPHNAARKILGLPPLVWNASILPQASAWAQHLANTYGCKTLVHGLTNGVGQNLANGSPISLYSNTDPVTWWVHEKVDYSYATNSCKPGKMCGHYTQVVWKGTTSVGCVSRECPSTNWKVWVCDYYPPGNYVGQKPY